jgi:hypothetical protein
MFSSPMQHWARERFPGAESSQACRCRAVACSASATNRHQECLVARRKMGWFSARFYWVSKAVRRRGRILDRKRVTARVCAVTTGTFRAFAKLAPGGRSSGLVMLANQAPLEIEAGIATRCAERPVRVFSRLFKLHSAAWIAAIVAQVGSKLGHAATSGCSRSA